MHIKEKSSIKAQRTLPQKSSWKIKMFVTMIAGRWKVLRSHKHTHGWNESKSLYSPYREDRHNYVQNNNGRARKKIGVNYKAN